MSTLVFIALAVLVWLLDFTVAPDDGLAKTLLPALATGLSALALARLLERALLRLLAARARLGSHSDRLHTMLAMVIYAATALGWLHYALGLNVTSLLATSAVVTLILGLALQATLGNLFTGLSLELERQLRVGDYIFKGPIEGEVVALKWRSVFLRTSNNTRIVLPNNGLTTDAVEIVPGGQPSRHTVFFAVRSHVPPMDVLAVTEDVLRSGVPKIHLEFPPSAVLLGPDPERGFLRYGARYYTLECLERSNIASNLQVRLWYALSRKGIAMAGWGVPPRDDGRLAAPLPRLAQDLVARLLPFGERRSYGPGEEIALGGGAALLLRGSAREEREARLDAERAQLARLLDDGPDEHGTVRMAAAPLAVIGERAARHLGPYAYALAHGYATRTDDPRLLHLALASHIQDEPDREVFLAEAPRHTSRRLEPGAGIGFARLLAPSTPGNGRIVSNRRCQILHLSAAALGEAIDRAVITPADLAAHDADLAAHDVDLARRPIDPGIAPPDGMPANAPASQGDALTRVDIH